jgi:hypothetical protein
MIRCASTLVNFPEYDKSSPIPILSSFWFSDFLVMAGRMGALGIVAMSFFPPTHILMGNSESKTAEKSTPPTSPKQTSANSNVASASGVGSIQHPNSVAVGIKADPKPILGGSVRNPLVSASPVTGSPLGALEQGSIGSSSWFGRNRQSYERNILGSSPMRDDFKQPIGERDYRNTAKIIHGFGPSGLAPLAPLKDSIREKTIPIMVVWSHPGKVVHITGTFNNWKKKIRLQKRF